MNKKVTRLFLTLLIVAAAGCTGASFDKNMSGKTTSTTTPTITNTETPTDIPSTEQSGTSVETPSATSASTLTVTPDATETKSRAEVLGERYNKYEDFSENYVELMVGGANMSVTTTDIDPDNKSIHIVHVAPTNNTTNYLSDQIALLYSYQLLINKYANETGTFAHVDRSWIPRTINVTVRTQDGRLYERAYIKYDWGLARVNGEISEREYRFLYIGEAEPGPAHPEEGI